MFLLDGTALMLINNIGALNLSLGNTKASSTNLVITQSVSQKKTDK